MHFDVAVLDVFNFSLRQLSKFKETKVEQQVNFIIDAIAKQILPIADNVWLVFDPIVDAMSNRTKTLTARQKVLASYKQNRQFPKDFSNVMHLVERYYAILANDKLHVIENKQYEADDFEMSIVADNKGKSIVLITNDLDWARCLSNNVVMLTKTDTIYTAADFEKENQFKPTYASLTLFKAIFGDPADNIPAVAARQSEFKKSAFYTIKHVSNSSMTLDELLDMLQEKTVLGPDTNLKDPVNRFVFMLWNSNQKAWAQQLLTNIDVIKSKNAVAKDNQQKLSKASLEANLILKRLGRLTMHKSFKLKPITVS